MNNTPIYAITHQPMGAVQMGAVQYGRSSGLNSSVSLLPPQYAGETWDKLTPWDTKDEKKAKEEAKAAEEAAFQERMASVGQNVTPAKQVSPLMLAVVGLMMAGGIYALTRS